MSSQTPFLAVYAYARKATLLLILDSRNSNNTSPNATTSSMSVAAPVVLEAQIVVGVATIHLSTSKRYRHRTETPPQKTTSHEPTPRVTPHRSKGLQGRIEERGVEQVWVCAPPTAITSNIAPHTVAKNRKPIESRRWWWRRRH